MFRFVYCKLFYYFSNNQTVTLFLSVIHMNSLLKHETYNFLFHYSLGYKPFMMAIYSQVVVLSKLLGSKQPPSPPPPKLRSPPRSRTTSSSIDPPSLSDTLTEASGDVEEGVGEEGSGRVSPSLSQASSHTEPSSCVVS